MISIYVNNYIINRLDGSLLVDVSFWLSSFNDVHISLVDEVSPDSTTQHKQ